MKISVVTPSFNQLDLLELCVASVKDQVGLQKAETGKVRPEIQVEHIIQDAGTEGLSEWVSALSRKLVEKGGVEIISDLGVFELLHLRTSSGYALRVFSQPDAGMYDAINQGFDHATGEIFAYLNSDEQYLPGALLEVARFFYEHSEEDIVFADALLIDENSVALSYRRTVLPDIPHLRLCHLNVLTCSTFFRTEVFRSGHRFPVDKKVIGDGIWVCGLLQSGIRMAYLKEVTSAYMFTGENLSELDRGENGEQRRWRQEPGCPPEWMEVPVRWLHRLKKLFAGAYLRRTLDYELFMVDRPGGRKLFHAKKLGGGWPGQTQ